MPMTARGIPRFLPTLTEVVHSPADMERVAMEPMALPEDVTPAPQAAPIADPGVSLMDDVDFQARLESRVRQLVTSALAAQVDRLTGQLMGELEPAVRQLVRESLVHEKRFPEPL